MLEKMTDNNFIFKVSNKDKWADINYRLIARITACRVHSKEDYQVEIKPYSKRSLNALNTYWMLIDKIVAWDKDVNQLKKGYFHRQFMEEAGLFGEGDKMPYWKMKYSNFKILEIPTAKDQYIIQGEGLTILEFLGDRYVQEPRSIANKGDVTKIEMERLIEAVLKFGSDNKVPKCFIEDLELERLLKSYK